MLEVAAPPAPGHGVEPPPPGHRARVRPRASQAGCSRQPARPAGGGATAAAPGPAIGRGRGGGLSDRAPRRDPGPAGRVPRGRRRLSSKLGTPQCPRSGSAREAIAHAGRGRAVHWSCCAARRRAGRGRTDHRRDRRRGWRHAHRRHGRLLPRPRAGRSARPGAVAEGFRQLWESGLVEDLAIELEELADGEVTLIVVVKERPFVTTVVFEGNKKLTTSTLKDKLDERGIELPRNVPLQMAQLQRIETAIREVYAEEGYRSAEVAFGSRTLGAKAQAGGVHHRRGRQGQDRQDRVRRQRGVLGPAAATFAEEDQAEAVLPALGQEDHLLARSPGTRTARTSASTT